MLVGAGLSVEGEDDEHAPRDGARRVAWGRYVVPQQLARSPSIDDLRKRVARHRTGRRFLLVMVTAVCGLLAFLVISPMWDTEVDGTTASNFGTTETGGQLIVTSSRNKRPIGVIGVSVDPGEKNQHRIGFWMHAGHRRHGHMTRALRLVADHLTTLDAALIAETGVHNLATQHVLGQAGFVRTGQRRVLLPNDEILDAVVFERHAPDEVAVDS